MSRRIIKDYEETLVELKQWVKDYFINNGNKDTPAVVGISGGKDSTVVAYLLADVLGPERVIGVKMPQGEQHDIDCADAVINNLGIKDYEINIGKICDAFYDEICIPFNFAMLNKGVITNTPPRIRMAMLYAVAAMVDGRVANTSNLSEKTVGWSTKWGDNCGDFSPLGGLTTEEVLVIGKMLGVPDDLLFKTPEDGLTGRSDEENLGVTYSEINDVIRQDYKELPYDTLRRIKELEERARHKQLCARMDTFCPELVDEDNPNIGYF